MEAGSDVQRLTAGGDIKIGSEIPPGECMLETSVADLLTGKNPTALKQLVDFRVVP